MQTYKVYINGEYRGTVNAKDENGATNTVVELLNISADGVTMTLLRSIPSQVSEYECPICHDQGCFRCQDPLQLDQ